MKKKGFIIGGASAVIVIAAAIVLILCLGNREELYRVIKVLNVNGKVVTNRESVGDIDAYEGMVLQSGDNLHVSGNSSLVLTMDEDKAAYVEENTQFSIIAEGNAANSKTYINIEYGAINCEVRNKLSNDSSYEVNTPNSTIAIRGTDVGIVVLDVSSAKDMKEDDLKEAICYFEFGKSFPEADDEEINAVNQTIEKVLNNEYKYLTRVSMLDGEVNLQLHDIGGNIISEISLGVGKEVIIGGNDRLSDVIAETSVKIDSFNQQALLNLKSVNEASGKTCFSDEEIDNGLTAKENKDEYTVYYTYNGSTFGKQTIQKGAKASKPSLMPTKKGSWDTNFDNPVERDTTIPWIEEKEESGSD